MAAKNEALVQGLPGADRSSRDAVLASALLDLRQRLEGITYAAYLPMADKLTLGVAMAVDTPCSFTLPTEMSLQDLRQPTVRAYQTSETIISYSEDQRNLVRQVPQFFLHIPFPMAVVSVPIISEGQNFGCLNVRWSRTHASEEIIDAHDVEIVRRAAQKIADQLLTLAEAGVSMCAPPIPKFIRPSAQSVRDGAFAVQLDAESEGVSGTTFLYQLKRLSTELAGAVELRDVLSAACRYVMEPLGGEALMLCRVQDERLGVVGSVGYARDEVKRVEGTPLSRSTPETDAVNRAEAGLQELVFPPVGRCPAADAPLSERHPQAYVPLIASGRSVGCCLLRFPAAWSRFPADEEIALAALMLGQIGQTLERMYVHEIEHVIARNIQQSLLPRVLPLRSETVVTSRYLPATEGAAIGGDWYDAIPLPDGGIGLVIGDVEGHNVEAAGVMGHLRSAVLAYATEGHDPATVLQRIDTLLRLLGVSRFVTCCCLWLDPVTGIARLASAGHPLPLISPAPGQLMEIDLPVGPPLGLGENHRYEQKAFTLEAGCVTTLFTDGLLAAGMLDLDESIARLATTLAEGDRDNLDSLADQLLSSGRLGKTINDDVALLIMRYQGRGADEEQNVSRMSVQRYDLQAVASIRHGLQEVLGRWEIEPLLEDAQLVLTEVVTNALVHAQSDVDIRLRRHDRGFRVEVQDNSPHPPVPRVIVTEDTMNAEAESGRGLLIVDALAAAWGSTPAGWGKTIWIEMALPGAESSEDGAH